MAFSFKYKDEKKIKSCKNKNRKLASGREGKTAIEAHMILLQGFEKLLQLRKKSDDVFGIPINR